MSDEEKKAIKHLKEFNDKGCLGIFDAPKNLYATILNLIEKQQKEIEQYRLLNANINKANEIIKDREYLISENRKLNNYIKQKNKVIENSISKDKVKEKIKEVQDVRKHHLDEIENIEAYNHIKQLWLKELDTKYIVLQSLLEKE